MDRYEAILFDAYGTLFDVYSVTQRCDEAFPGRGSEISQIWRRKQLEYTWLLSLMGRYEPFYEVTRRALVFTLKSLNLTYRDALCDEILNEYNRLSPFPEVRATLSQLSGKALAILSNGNYEMLDAVVKHNALSGLIPRTISVDEIKIFKPFLGVYQLGPAKLGVPREKTLFVSANPWDIAGAKTFGLATCWMNRAKQPFDELGVSPDHEVTNLTELLHL